MAITCPHGLPASECLICPRLPDASKAVAVPAPRRGSVGLHVAGVVAAVAVLGVVVWFVYGVVFGILHILELVLVAAAAGWAGYRVGHFRGRRSGGDHRDGN